MARLCKLLAVAAAFAFAAQAASSKEWTSIRIATEGAYAPWNFKEPSGKLSGFDVDLADELCRRMALKCEIDAQDWDGIIPALNAGKFDAIVASLTITDKRKEAINFSMPYADSGRSLIVLKSSPLAKIPRSDAVYSLTADEKGAQAAIGSLKPVLKGKIVAAQASTTGEAFLERYFKGVVEVRTYKTSEQYLLDLVAGRVDAAIDNVAYLQSVLDQGSGAEMTIVGPAFNGGVFGGGKAVGLRKSDPELREKFDAAIRSTIADGTLRKLSLKWFKVDITPRE